MTVDVGHPLLLACRGEPAEHVPVWFMRQAGRSLPEYQKVRESHSLLDICHEPELTAEVTLQPVDRLGVDAAILFSDIVVPLLGVGIDVRLVDGVGPVIDDPIASAADLQRLRPLQPSEDVPYVAEAVRLIVKEAAVPLIGFAGAPFTLACYLIEGGPSKDKARTKALMLGEPALWSDLMGRLAGIVGALLRAQVEAGAQVVQLFDSWAGWLTPADYAARVAPYSRSILTGLDDLGVPRIHFGVNTGELLGEMKDAGADVVGVDWRTPLDAARRRLGPDVPVQGNLDPAACLAPSEIVAAKVADVLQRGGGRGHIFNLGHGVLPQTDPDTLARVVELVHGWAPS